MNCLWIDKIQLGESELKVMVWEGEYRMLKWSSI